MPSSPSQGTPVQKSRFRTLLLVTTALSLIILIVTLITALPPFLELMRARGEWKAAEARSAPLRERYEEINRQINQLTGANGGYSLEDVMTAAHFCTTEMIGEKYTGWSGEEGWALMKASDVYEEIQRLCPDRAELMEVRYEVSNELLDSVEFSCTRYDDHVKMTGTLFFSSLDSLPAKFSDSPLDVHLRLKAANGDTDVRVEPYVLREVRAGESASFSIDLMTAAAPKNGCKVSVDGWALSKKH